MTESTLEQLVDKYQSTLKNSNESEALAAQIKQKLNKDVKLIEIVDDTFVDPKASPPQEPLSKWLDYLVKQDVVLKRSKDDIAMHARSGAMRCFAYTHPEMPNELLNILYVAERADVSKSRADVYTPADKSLANVAMLCAGNVTCKGLLGFDLPYRLINELKTDKSIIPASWDVVSLSPMPTFRKWLDALIADNTNASKIEKYLTGEDIRYLRIQGKNSNICEAMCTLLADWVGTLENPTLGKEMPLALEMPLKRLGLAYLRGTREEKGKIRSLDSVYGIHVAKCKEEVVGLHPMADPTTNGIQQSYGMLVNYQSRGNREDIDKLLKIGRTLQ